MMSCMKNDVDLSFVSSRCTRQVDACAHLESRAAKPIVYHVGHGVGLMEQRCEEAIDCAVFMRSLVQQHSRVVQMSMDRKLQIAQEVCCAMRCML